MNIKEIIMDEEELNARISNLKQAGYIKKDIVEEAEEMYINYTEEYGSNASFLIPKQHEAIQYLKKQLEEK